MVIVNNKDLKWSKSEEADITPSSRIQNADENSDSKRFEREKHLEFLDIPASVIPRLDEVIKSKNNSLEELKKELKEKDERTAELEKENAELKEQLSKK
jgi:hypothetical protein